MTCRIRTGDWKDKTMNLEGKRVLVVGSGKSGVAAAELLRKKGITFVLFDGNKDLDVTALIEKNPVFAGAEILLGELAPEDMARIDLVVLSPGVPTDLPMVNELRNRQIPIWGEIELAYHFAKGRIIAMTGTNGKTTTTSLDWNKTKVHFEGRTQVIDKIVYLEEFKEYGSCVGIQIFVKDDLKGG